MKYTVAEFFCGCGGFSRGFTNSGRFKAVLGNDVKPEALNTFRLNHSSELKPPATLLQDIRTLKIAQIENALRESGVEPGDLDCMIGGPPCQGFSQLRRSTEKEEGQIAKFRGYSQLAEDPRNDLVLRYLDVAEALRPKVLVIENVPQMLNHGFDGRLGKLSEIVIQMLEKELGYKVEVAIVNSAEYGVPQLRERALFIASTVGAASFPEATHTDPGNTSQLTKGKLPWVTVSDAIRDLPKPLKDGSELGGGALDLYGNIHSPYAALMRTAQAFPYNHVTRSYNMSVLNIIKEMRPGKTWDAESERMRKRYARAIRKYAIDYGITERRARNALLKTGKINPVFYKDYYWSAYGRLTWESPALTITANANYLGSGQFSHPNQQRGITMREAARLQSFDDEFKFLTSVDDQIDTRKINIGMDMIGEAVPPLLAKAIAVHLAAQLDSHRDH